MNFGLLTFRPEPKNMISPNSVFHTGGFDLSTVQTNGTGVQEVLTKASWRVLHNLVRRETLGRSNYEIFDIGHALTRLIYSFHHWIRDLWWKPLKSSETSSRYLWTLWGTPL